MKVAICLSGHLRKFDQTFPSLEKYFLSRYDCDIFIHTWDKLGYQSRFKNDATTDNTNDKIDTINYLYKPKKIIVEHSNFIDDLRLQSNVYAPHLVKEPKPPHHMASMFYKIFACNEIRRQYQEETFTHYDWVVRSRSDLLFHGNVTMPISDIENKIFIPRSIYHPQWYNDQFAIASPNNMDVYAASYFDIPQYFHIKEEYFPEKFMMWTLQNKGFSAEWCDGHFSILR
jgi:hypothetical protein